MASVPRGRPFPRRTGLGTDGGVMRTVGRGPAGGWSREVAGPDPGSPRHLVTVRELGYKFET